MLTDDDLAAIAKVMAETLEAYGFKRKRSSAALRQARYREKHGNLRDRRLKLAGGSHTHSQWLGRVEVNTWQCWYCRAKLTPKTVQKEHRIPLARGGTNWPSNLVPACRTCNSSKGAMTPMEFWRSGI